MRRAKYLLFLVPAILAGCVGGSKETKEDTEALRAYILDKAPADIGTPLNINYDNKVTMLGAKVTPPGTIRAGQRVKVTMYWRSDKAIDDKGWKLFTHILDGSGERILNIDNVGPLRRVRAGEGQAMSPDKWKPGKIYVDEQDFTLPKRVKSSTVQVTVGIWKGDDRLPILSGPKDRLNRGIVATLQTSATEEPARSTRVPELRVDKMPKDAKVTIDGKLDEDVWKTAPVAGPFVDVRTGRVNTTFPVNGSAKVLWDDKGLYVGFDVKDPDVTGDFDKNAKDAHLWTKDTVEMMVDPDGDGDNKDYYEIQVNPQNLVFDSRFDTYNLPKKGPDGPFGNQDWSSQIKSAVVVNGTLNKSDDKDQGYVVEAMVPWKAFDKAKQVPPGIGQSWRINFYAMQNNGGVAWSPILGQGNFHRASRFGRVLFAEKGWVAPAAEGSAAPAGSEGAPVASGAPPMKEGQTVPAGSSKPMTAQSGAPKLPKPPASTPKVATPTPAPKATAKPQ